MHAILLVLVGAPVPWKGFDLFGDPLPKGAVARLGTARLQGRGAAYSADGKTLALLGPRGATLWSAESGKLLTTLPDALGTVARFPPDGKRLTVSLAHEVRGDV